MGKWNQVRSWGAVAVKEDDTAGLFFGVFGTWRGFGGDDEGIEPGQVERLHVCAHRTSPDEGQRGDGGENPALC
jgi:hypothetical protein